MKTSYQYTAYISSERANVENTIKRYEGQGWQADSAILTHEKMDENGVITETFYYAIFKRLAKIWEENNAID